MADLQSCLKVTFNIEKCLYWMRSELTSPNLWFRSRSHLQSVEESFELGYPALLAGRS